MNTNVSSKLNNECKDINDLKGNIVWFDGEVRIFSKPLNFFTAFVPGIAD